MSTNDGGPAFPFTVENGDGSFTHYKGASLRDWFAGMALQGMLANTDDSDAALHRVGALMKLVAINAYEAADAMLAARSAK